MRNKFTKTERLRSEKQIEDLFRTGSSGFVYPLKFLYKIVENENINDDKADVKILITVPKRYFKKAVHRNRIKRLLRETYRTRKQYLFERLKNKNITLNIAFIFLGKELPDFKQTDAAMEKILKKLTFELKDK